MKEQFLYRAYSAEGESGSLPLGENSCDKVSRIYCPIVSRQTSIRHPLIIFSSCYNLVGKKSIVCNSEH